ncbi:MAG: SUMF1/EgtB/PvdO family nonheme iron enzyme, partial [Desulfomonilaceae bacterium]
ARSLVEKIPELQNVNKGCLEDTSGFVKDVLRGFIDETSDKSIESFENSLGMRMVRVPEGSFVMGSSEADISWAMTVLARGQPVSLENEYPFHKVRISKPFFMADTPVTVRQFQAFIDDTGYITDAEEDNGGEVFDTKENRFVRREGSSWRNPGWRIEPDQPVVMITYNDAVAFCEWLSAKEHSPYKLPTEAQWEYAARGGLPMKQFPWGDQLPDGKRANYADSNTDFEWRDRDVNDGYKFVSPVGSYASNGFGLYDMAGNVLEWVRDFYQEDYYRYTPEIDPEGPGQGENMVMKGGDFTSGAVSLRCAFRGWAKPDLALYNGGFRVIMDTSSPQRPFHFSENFLTQQWVPNPEQREVAQALAREKERSLKNSDRDAGSKADKSESVETSGVLIMEFTPKSDAKKFGVLKGDVIIEYDGVTNLDCDKLIALTARTKKERRRPIIKLVRDGSIYSVQVPAGSLGISITDTVIRGPFKQDGFEKDSGQPNRANGKKKKQWM